MAKSTTKPRRSPCPGTPGRTVAELRVEQRIWLLASFSCYVQAAYRRRSARESRFKKRAARDMERVYEMEMTAFSFRAKACHTLSDHDERRNYGLPVYGEGFEMPRATKALVRELEARHAALPAWVREEGKEGFALLLRDARDMAAPRRARASKT